MNTADELNLRPAPSEAGLLADGAFAVVWKDLEIGQIKKMSGCRATGTDWIWELVLPGKPQLAGQPVGCGEIIECKSAIGAAWSRVRATLTEGEIIIMRRQALDARLRALWLSKNRTRAD